MPNWRGRNGMMNCPTSSFHPSLCPTAPPSPPAPPPAPPPLPHPADSMKNTRDYKAKHRRRHNEGRDKNLRLFVSPAAAQKAGHVSKRQKKSLSFWEGKKKIWHLKTRVLWVKQELRGSKCFVWNKRAFSVLCSPRWLCFAKTTFHFSSIYILISEKNQEVSSLISPNECWRWAVWLQQ